MYTNRCKNRKGKNECIHLFMNSCEAVENQKKKCNIVLYRRRMTQITYSHTQTADMTTDIGYGIQEDTGRYCHYAKLNYRTGINTLRRLFVDKAQDVRYPDWVWVPPRQTTVSLHFITALMENVSNASGATTLDQIALSLLLLILPMRKM